MTTTSPRYGIIVSHGSSLPHDLGHAAEARLGCRIMQGYGSVDCGGLCATSWDDPADVRSRLGGQAPGGERDSHHGRARQRAAAGRDRPPVGPWAALPTRASWITPNSTGAGVPTAFLDLEEWGRMDEHGNIYLMGRDRGPHHPRRPEHLSARPGDLLARHPKVREAAVVGYADPEMGERIAHALSGGRCLVDVGGGDGIPARPGTGAFQAARSPGTDGRIPQGRVRGQGGTSGRSGRVWLRGRRAVDVYTYRSVGAVPTGTRNSPGSRRGKP